MYSAQKLKKQLMAECQIMVDFAKDGGDTPDPNLASRLEALSIEIHQLKDADALGDPSIDGNKVSFADAHILSRLTEIHNVLAELILPAKPRAVMAFSGEEGKKARKPSLMRFSSNIPLVKRMWLTALLSLISLIGFSLFPQVDGDQGSFNLLSNEGTNLLLNYMFLLSAASMGACFSGLFTANKFIKDGTIDPIMESTYWSRYILGLMGGIMIAMLIPVDTLMSVMDGGAPETEAEKKIHSMGAPLLALVGGFASNLVYVILAKLVKLMESVVKPDPKAGMNAKLTSERAKIADQATKTKMSQAQQINLLQKRVAESGNVEEVQKELQKMQEQLLRD